jgi:hypothetical protein
MSGIVQQTLPTSEPVSLTDATNFLKINTTADNTLLLSLITGARQYMEDQLNIYLASRTFVQYKDSFPQFPFLPSPYAPYTFPFGFPMVSNYPAWTFGSNQPPSSDIRLMAWPVTAVDHVTYIGLDGEPHNLYPDTDFVVDFVSRPTRISLLPTVNAAWPQTASGANCVAIYFTAGYNSIQSTVESMVEPVGSPPEAIAGTTFVTGIPAQLWTAILLLTSHWYFNREPVSAGSAVVVPHSVQAIIDLNRIQNFDLLGLL